MLKMFQYVKDKWHYIVLIIALLFLQAFCDLSLPDYTSKIVNVGIQQKGVEDGVPTDIREESMDKLFLFMSKEDQEKVKAEYDLNDGVYTLKSIDEDTRDELNQIFGKPMLAVTGLSGDSDQAKAVKEQMGLLQEADIFEVFAQMPEEQREQMVSKMTESFDQMPESIVTQTATTYVYTEYEEMGKDVGRLQTDYILFSGLKMLGLALLGMMAAICVTFLCAVWLQAWDAT